ncbi:MAG: hypothetical protein MJ189_00600 [Coriobacteriales bacterium]|nr:hypothetical protein [Coriobacteriales bacterium]
MQKQKAKKTFLSSKIDKTTYENLNLIVVENPRLFNSVSDLIETIINFVKLLEIENQQFINELIESKIIYINENACKKSKIDLHLLHATLSQDSFEYLDFFLDKYPNAFYSKSEFLNIICRHVLIFYNTKRSKNYILKRLKDVKEKMRLN